MSQSSTLDQVSAVRPGPTYLLPTHDLHARLLGWCAGAVVMATYLVGSSRAFGYDESVTVGRFVATPSLYDPLRRQVVYNNHVAFSFLEHIVYSLTGSSDEVVMRILPVAFAAACVGLLVTTLAAHATRWVAVIAGCLLATNPLFALMARAVRGYSLLCLCALASTILLRRMQGEDSGRRELAYVGLVALGLATHLYMLFVVAGHVLYIIVNREFSIRWILRWLSACVVGGAAYIVLASAMLRADRGRLFTPNFPELLVRELLGEHLLTILITATGVALTLWALRRRRDVRVLAMFYVVLVLWLWAIAAPRDLYPRFFVWCAPFVAAAAALGLNGLARRKTVTLGVAVACVLSLAIALPEYGSDELSNRAVASQIERTRLEGLRPCGIGNSTEALAAYANHVRAIHGPADLAVCDLAVALEPKEEPGLVADAYRLYPHHATLHGRTQGLVFWR